MSRTLKVIVEKHADGYVAYPVGLKGVVVAQGDSFDEALEAIASAVQFHVETFGWDELEADEVATELFVAETVVLAG